MNQVLRKGPVTSMLTVDRDFAGPGTKAAPSWRDGRDIPNIHEFFRRENGKPLFYRTLKIQLDALMIPGGYAFPVSQPGDEGAPEARGLIDGPGRQCHAPALGNPAAIVPQAQLSLRNVIPAQVGIHVFLASARPGVTLFV